MASALLMRTSQAGALAGQHASKPAVCPKPALARVMCPGSRLVLTRFQPSSVDHLTTPYVTLKEVLEDLDMLVPPMSGTLQRDCRSCRCCVGSGVPLTARHLAAGDNYKGLHGRIGVIGGDTMYTGAPYFSAMAALQVGSRPMPRQVHAALEQRRLTPYLFFGSMQHALPKGLVRLILSSMSWVIGGSAHYLDAAAAAAVNADGGRHVFCVLQPCSCHPHQELQP